MNYNVEKQSINENGGVNKMKVLYNINLNNYYSKHFNTFYLRELIIDNDGLVKTTVDEFRGYLNYKLFDKEDEVKAHKEARELLQEDLDKIIYDIDIINDIAEVIKIIENSKCIQTIKLKDKTYKVKEHDFILSVNVSN